MSKTFSAKDVADRYGVDARTVLFWIKSGELRAINGSRKINSKKPRWRITQESIEAFELLRGSTRPPAKANRRRQRPPDVIEFY
jgi:predicted site-specific integrase-resolvase